MTEIFFYHLQRQPLEAVLPGLLERTLERGWRAVVQAASVDRIAALDAHLWTYRDESFLPHSAEGDGAVQPIYLTDGPGNPNAATVRFLVDGSPLGETTGYERVILIFDGNDTEATADAREAWKTARAAGHAVTYWLQNDAGRWEKKSG